MSDWAQSRYFLYDYGERIMSVWINFKLVLFPFNHSENKSLGLIFTSWTVSVNIILNTEHLNRL